MANVFLFRYFLTVVSRVPGLEPTDDSRLEKETNKKQNRKNLGPFSSGRQGLLRLINVQRWLHVNIVVLVEADWVSLRKRRETDRQ